MASEARARQGWGHRAADLECDSSGLCTEAALASNSNKSPVAVILTEPLMGLRLLLTQNVFGFRVHASRAGLWKDLTDMLEHSAPLSAGVGQKL